VLLMLALILATVTSYQDPYVAPENIRRHCAAVVGIPYASDNFSEKEWQQFVGCVRKHLKKDV
jgi:hypothetical protein